MLVIFEKVICKSIISFVHLFWRYSYFSFFNDEVKIRVDVHYCLVYNKASGFSRMRTRVLCNDFECNGLHCEHALIVTYYMFSDRHQLVQIYCCPAKCYWLVFLSKTICHPLLLDEKKGLQAVLFKFLISF